MQVQLRSPNSIMKLSRLGSFHQSKLSFLRSFLNEFKDWEYKRDLFKLNDYKELANKINNYCVNKKKCKKKILLGYKNLHRFDHKKNCQKYYKILDKH